LLFVGEKQPQLSQLVGKQMNEQSHDEQKGSMSAAKRQARANDACSGNDLGL